MKNKRKVLHEVLAPALGMACAATAGAQTVQDRTSRPLPEGTRPSYTQIDARDAKMPPRTDVKAPKGAPNVVIILIDDLGFGATSTFGGPIRTEVRTAWRSGGFATTTSTPRRFPRRRAPRSRAAATTTR